MRRVHQGMRISARRWTVGALVAVLVAALPTSGAVAAQPQLVEAGRLQLPWPGGGIAVSGSGVVVGDAALADIEHGLVRVNGDLSSAGQPIDIGSADWPFASPGALAADSSGAVATVVARRTLVRLDPAGTLTSLDLPAPIAGMAMSAAGVIAMVDDQGDLAVVRQVGNTLTRTEIAVSQSLSGPVVFESNTEVLYAAAGSELLSFDLVGSPVQRPGTIRLSATVTGLWADPVRRLLFAGTNSSVTPIDVQTTPATVAPVIPVPAAAVPQGVLGSGFSVAADAVSGDLYVAVTGPDPQVVGFDRLADGGYQAWEQPILREYVSQIAVAADGSVYLPVSRTRDLVLLKPVEPVEPVVTASFSPDEPNGDNGWWTDPVRLTMSVLPVEAVVNYRVGDQPWSVYSDVIAFDQDGEFDVSWFGSGTPVSAPSPDANVGHRTLKIDGTAPTVAVSTLPTAPDLANGAYRPGVSISAVATDPTSGVAIVESRVNDGAWTSGETVELNTPGSWSVTFRATDLAGNQQTADAIAVTVGLPSDVVVSWPQAQNLVFPVGSGTLNARVTNSAGAVSGGTAVFLVDGEAVGSTRVRAGNASLTLPVLAENPVPVGYHELSVRYENGSAASALSPTKELLVHYRDVPPIVSGQARPFFTEIMSVTGSGIATGYADGTFRPGGPVARDAMAAFLYRMAHPGVPLPECTGTRPFWDVPVSNPFCGAIKWLVQNKISTGYADGSFRPGGWIDRGAMAAFLYRFDNPNTPLPVCGGTRPFWDVRVGDPFCGAISWLAQRKISTGNADGSFAPLDLVSRQAMAAFLIRLRGLR